MTTVDNQEIDHLVVSLIGTATTNPNQPLAAGALLIDNVKMQHAVKPPIG